MRAGAAAYAQENFPSDRMDRGFLELYQSDDLATPKPWTTNVKQWRLDERCHLSRSEVGSCTT